MVKVDKFRSAEPRTMIISHRDGLYDGLLLRVLHAKWGPLVFWQDQSRLRLSERIIWSLHSEKTMKIIIRMRVLISFLETVPPTFWSNYPVGKEECSIYSMLSRFLVANTVHRREQTFLGDEFITFQKKQLPLIHVVVIGHTFVAWAHCTDHAVPETHCTRAKVKQYRQRGLQLQTVKKMSRGLRCIIVLHYATTYYCVVYTFNIRHTILLCGYWSSAERRCRLPVTQINAVVDSRQGRTPSQHHCPRRSAKATGHAGGCYCPRSSHPLRRVTFRKRLHYLVQ